MTQTSDNGQELVDELPPWMPKDESSGNFKLMDVVGRAVDRLDSDIENVDDAIHVQTANSVDEIHRVAKLVSLPPKDGESKEKYRARTIAEFQKLTSEGTIRDILTNSASILDVEPSEIEYTELSENGVVELTLPLDALDQVSLTSAEFVDVIEGQLAAGFRLEAILRGTFTYISVTEYNNNNHDASKGYTTDSDNDGTPDSGGGTYSGVI